MACVATRAENCNETVEACAAETEGARAYGVDVSATEDVVALVEQVKSELGGLEVLVNNAGVTRDQLLLRMSEEDFDRVIAVNLKGVYLCTRAVLPGMMDRRYGRIVSVASISGRYGRAQMSAAYSASKAGILGFTRSVAKRYGEYGVTANAIAPGTIITDMNRDLPAETLDRLKADAAIPRLGAPADVAEAVRFLVSEEAGWITGVTIDISGGTIIG